MTSTGTGIRHSEYNEHRSAGVHFLQIWALPHTRGLKPSYYTRHTTDEEKTNKLVRLVAPVTDKNVEDQRLAQGPAPVHSWLSMDASILTPGSTVQHVISKPYNSSSDHTAAKKVYIHLTQSSGYKVGPASNTPQSSRLRVTSPEGTSISLGEGDGVYVIGGQPGDAINIESSGGGNAEFVLFEMD